MSFYLCAIENEAERDKLAIIYNEYLSNMSRTAHRYVGKYQADGDVVHNAILKIIDNLHRFNLNDKASTYSYVCCVTFSCAIDWLRHERKFLAEDIDKMKYMVESDVPLPIEQVMTKDGYQQLVQCIRSLKDIYRAACELKFLCGMKEREIAEILGITEKNTGIRIVRGRQALIKMLIEDRDNDK